MKSPLDGIQKEFAVADHVVWSKIKEHFSAAEFQFPYEMDAAFLLLLYKIRKEAGVPFKIISDARDPNGSIGADKSAHKKRPCRAVDLQVKNAYERACVVLAAARCGIVRIGIYPGSAGDGGGVHLDAETDISNPSPRIWTKY